MARTLVVCFSRTGHTRWIAERLAERLGADLDVITEKTSRGGLRGFLRSGYEATLQREAAIDQPTFDPARYDVVLIGTPVWNASVSSPVRAYLRRYRTAFRAVAFFLSFGGRGEARVFSQMQQATGLAPLCTLAMRDAERGQPAGQQRLAAFVDRLAQLRPAAMAPAA
jgi:flavodoxin